MTESHPERPTAPQSPSSGVSKPGSGRGNRSKTGQTSTTKPDTAPLWHKRARQALANDVKLGRFRQWGGTATAPNLNGGTVTAPDPRKSTVPNPARPYLASYGGKQSWHGSPTSARVEIEAAFVRQQNAEREARLAKDPFSDPVKRAALARALRGLRGL